MDRLRREPFATQPPWSSLHYLITRALVLALLFVGAISAVFVFIHLGPSPPVEATAQLPAERDILEQRKHAFGLYRPLWVQYVDYLQNMLTFDFGESWKARAIVRYVRLNPTTDVNALLAEYLPQTLWLWLWTLVLALGIGLPVGVGLGLTRDTQQGGIGAIGGAFIRAVPVFVLAMLLAEILPQSETLLFGFDWSTFLVETPLVSGPRAWDPLDPPRSSRRDQTGSPASARPHTAAARPDRPGEPARGPGRDQRAIR